VLLKEELVKEAVGKLYETHIPWLKAALALVLEASRHDCSCNRAFLYHTGQIIAMMKADTGQDLHFYL